MNARITILALTAIFVVGVAVPALGQDSAVTPTVEKGLPTRALAKARLALLTARSAKSQSRLAARTAQAAVNTANDAKGTATDARSAAAATQAILDSTRIVSGSAPGAISTESGNYVQLAGGPSVTVTVPSSGLIEVWGQARISDSGAVALFEDSQLMPGQSEECGPGEEGLALFSSIGGPPATVGTPGVPSFVGCGTVGAPAPVLFQTSPGVHTYELRYASCGCPSEVTFSKRLLRVGPRL